MTAHARVESAEPKSARPFLKWLGGKTQLLAEIDKHVPITYRRYFEPFVGGGAVFFHLRRRRFWIRDATLGDQNADLVATYQAIRDEVVPLIRTLNRYARRYDTSEDNRARIYNAVRSKKTRTDNTVATAARLIFLNRTGFNGVYRVNRDGEFNVPKASYKNPRICDAENLAACSVELSGVSVHASDFEATSDGARKGDFWYADPPYVPLSASSDFTSYTKEPFGPTEQERLAAFARKLQKRGVHVLLSNSETPLVRSLYRGFNIRRVAARRAVNSRTDRRGHVGELLIFT